MYVSYSHSGGLGNRINSIVSALAMAMRDGQDHAGVAWSPSLHCGAKFHDVLKENDKIQYVGGHWGDNRKITVANLFEDKYRRAANVDDEFKRLYSIAAKSIEWSDEVLAVSYPHRYYCIQVRWNAPWRKHCEIDKAIQFLSDFDQNYLLCCDNPTIRKRLASELHCFVPNSEISEADTGARGTKAVIEAAREMHAMCSCNTIFQLGAPSSFTHLPVYGYNVNSFLLDSLV